MTTSWGTANERCHQRPLGGDDTVYGGAAMNSLDGMGGDDTIYGLEGDDIITGGADNDALYGGSGDDGIDGGAGDDVPERREAGNGPPTWWIAPATVGY